MAYCEYRNIDMFFVLYGGGEMSEIKYEAVFGDYKFSSPACEVAIQSSFGEIIERRFTKPLVIPEGWGVIAMRRIICTPIWTVADQKAGKLPEVGCNVFDEMNENEVIVKAINARQVCLESPDGFIYLLPQADMKPIESPE